MGDYVDGAAWDFPEKVECFNPQGTMFEKVFSDPIALAIYAQYRRKHIVSQEINELLSTAPLEVSRRVRRANKYITLNELVGITMDAFGWSLLVNKEEWNEMLLPILPFVNGTKKLVLVSNDEEWFLQTEEA